MPSRVDSPVLHLKNPIVIDREREYKNEAGEVVPFGVTKVCTKCGKTKDLWGDFHMRTKSPDLHQPWCKQCVNQSATDRKRGKQGALLVKVPDKVKIHAGYGVSVPDTALPIKPVVTPQPESVPEAELEPIDENEVTMETPVAVLEAASPQVAVVPDFPTPTITVPPAEPAGEPMPAPKPLAPVGEAPRPAMIFKEIVDFHDWVTGPNNANSFFITRGFEAIVELCPDGKCVIATPNQKGPGRSTDLDMTVYILKLLTGESTDDVLHGMIYRR
ncbi:MAG: hypothetical protein ACXWQ5_00935 [Ktedonobacterales bacterium]